MFVKIVCFWKKVKILKFCDNISYKLFLQKNQSK